MNNIQRQLTNMVAIGLLTLCPTVLAVEQCIQAPKRAVPCPHQIYKLMKFKADQPAKVTCVCVADFAKFLVPAKDDVEKQLRKLELKGLAADLQLTELQVKNLAKR
jgi:hypothetical protein